MNGTGIQHTPPHPHEHPRTHARTRSHGRTGICCEHDRPEGLEGMSSSYRAEMWRRLHIRIVLSRMGCATYPHHNNREISPPQDVRNSVMALFWPVWEFYWELYWELY
jgi:hypothetical protein